jgi:hypothetical protein
MTGTFRRWFNSDCHYMKHPCTEVQPDSSILLLSEPQLPPEAASFKHALLALFISYEVSKKLNLSSDEVAK